MFNKYEAKKGIVQEKVGCDIIFLNNYHLFWGEGYRALVDFKLERKC